MQKLCCVRTRQHSLPVWIISSQVHHHISTNSQPFLVGIVSPCIDHVPDSPYGGIDLPPDEFYQLHSLSSKHPPSQRPGRPSRPLFRPQSQHPRPTKPIRRYDGPIFLPPQICKLLSQDAMKALKAYNTEAITRFHQRKLHNTEIVETPQDDPPGPQYLKMTSLTFLKVIYTSLMIPFLTL